MGKLVYISSPEKNVHMITTGSSIAEMYVYDNLKRMCNANIDSVLEVSNKATFSEMVETVNIQPYLADKWLIVIDYKKVKALVKKYRGAFESDTSRFLVKVSNYREFKEFKELVPGVNDIYLSRLGYKDIAYLLNDYGLSQSALDFVVKSYSRSPDKIFLLRNELEKGLKIKDSKDIVKVCGESSSSVNHFVFLLLSVPPKSKSGITRVCKKRVQVANTLLSVYGVGTFRNFVISSVRDIMYIKQLYLQGVIYNSIRNIPDCFDESKLSRYSMYLKTISDEIPMSRIVNLFVSLCNSGVWSKENDVIEFIYKYYEGVV